MQEEITNLGVVEDPRSEIEKAQDHPAEEFVLASAGGTPEWKEKEPSTWRFFSRRNQSSSLSCMAQSGAKTLGIENVVEEGVYVEISAKPVYDARANFPGGGMFQQDCLSLYSKPLACLESQLQSQDLGESEMNMPYTQTPEMKSVAEKYRANGYNTVPVDMDALASIVATGKAIQLMMFFTGEEWWRNVPTLIEGSDFNQFSAKALRHGIAIVDFTLYKGEKAFIIEDSAGNSSSIDGKGQRVLTESFFKKRCYSSGILLAKKNADDSMQKPKHIFTQRLAFGMMGNQEVAEWQKVLQYEKFLPLTLDGKPLPLGNFLQMTAQATKKWQVAHNILDFANEPDVRKIIVGPKTRREANKIYE